MVVTGAPAAETDWNYPIAFVADLPREGMRIHPRELAEERRGSESRARAFDVRGAVPARLIKVIVRSANRGYGIPEKKIC